MKKITLVLLSIFLASTMLFSQAFVTVSGSSIITVIGRGITWSTFSGLGIQYSLTPPSASLGLCLYITNNNPTNSRTVNITAVQTGDPSTQVTSNARYVAATGGSLAGSTQNPLTISASQTQAYYFFTQGATHFKIGAFQESGTVGGSPDTVDLIGVYSSGCPSGGNTSSAPGGTVTSVSGPIQWAVLTIPAIGAQATTSKAAAVSIRHTANAIAASLTCTTAAVQTNDLVIRDGACGAGTIVFVVALSCSATAGNGTTFGLSGMNVAGTPGNAMCVEFSTAPAAGGQQRVSLYGYDQ